MNQVFICSICETFQSLTLRSLLNHIHVVHSHLPNFNTKCPVDTCGIIFTRYNSLYKHVTRHHGNTYKRQNEQSSASASSALNVNNINVTIDEETVDYDNIIGNTDYDSEKSTSEDNLSINSSDTFDDNDSVSLDEIEKVR